MIRELVGFPTHLNWTLEVQLEIRCKTEIDHLQSLDFSFCIAQVAHTQ